MKDEKERTGSATEEEMHMHFLMEIGYCTGGGGIFKLEDHEYPSFPGMCSIIPPFFSHQIIPGQDGKDHWERVLMDLDDLFFDMFPVSCDSDSDLWFIACGQPFLFAHEDVPVLGDLIMQVMVEQRTKKPFYEEMIRGLMIEILVEVARMIVGEGE